MNKRKGRRNNSFRRRVKQREPYDVILIVCEGSKTEPDYFKALKNELRLSGANIIICGQECGTDPLSIVGFALQKQKERYAFDRVFCVFDRDQHNSYNSALDKIHSQPSRVKIEAITSVPCFEVWILLHFVLTTRPYASGSTRSICEQVVHDLQQYIPRYAKGMNNVFDLTYQSVNTAIANAEQRAHQCQLSGNDNPSTNVHNLIKYLQNIKRA